LVSGHSFDAFSPTPKHHTYPITTIGPGPEGLIDFCAYSSSSSSDNKMTVNNRQLYHRTVGNGSFDLPQSFLPTSTVSPTNSKRKERRQMNVLGRMGGFLSKQSLLILLCGTMLGYVVLPVVLTQTSSIADAVTTQLKPVPSSSTRALGMDDIMIRLIEDKKLLSKQSLPTDRSPHIMETATLSDHRRKKVLVTGGAGFVGSHLVDKLMMEGHEVTVVDNFFTGQKKNVAHWMHHPNFKYVEWMCLFACFDCLSLRTLYSSRVRSLSAIICHCRQVQLCGKKN
jgi:hypothetical protein